MPTRYFRKQGDGGVPLSNGQQAKFTSVDGGLSAYLGTSDAWLAAEFEKAMAEHRSGLTEVDFETFNREYLLKKNSAPISKTPWREELVRGQLMVSDSTLRDRLIAAQDVVAVASPPPPAPPPSPTALSHAQAAVNADIAKALPTVADYKPEVGKRKKKS